MQFLSVHKISTTYIQITTHYVCIHKHKPHTLCSARQHHTNSSQTHTIITTYTWVHNYPHTAQPTAKSHQTREPPSSYSTNLRPPWSWFHTIPILYGFTQTNQTHTHHPRPKITTHHQNPIRDPYMGSPKSRVRVRVSREFEREGEAIDAVREKCRERERQGTALPNQNPPPPVAVESGGGECTRSSSMSSRSWPWSRWEKVRLEREKREKMRGGWSGWKKRKKERDGSGQPDPVFF